MMITSKQLQEQATTHGITRWIIHRCGFCNYPCGFYFHGESVAYDNGCDCSYEPMRPSDWNDVADHFNLQRLDATVAEYREFWHLDDSPPEDAEP